MPTDFKGQFAAASSPDFQERVAAALRAVAVIVYGENAATAGHVARAAYALQVVQNAPLSMVTTNQFGTTSPDKIVYAWSGLLACQGLDNGSSDALIQAQMLSNWNAMAGA